MRIGAGALVLLASIVGVTVHESGKNAATAKPEREDLTAVVSASGEIKPKTYVNIGANAFGKNTHLFVRQGNRVRKGQVLAQLENVQSSADVNANQASPQAAETDALAAEAALKAAQADLLRTSRLRAQQARLGSRPKSFQRRVDLEIQFRQPQEHLDDGR